MFFPMFSLFNTSAKAPEEKHILPIPNYWPLPMARQDRPTCQTCFFWQQHKAHEDDTKYERELGNCKRHPENRYKHIYDWCGEWK